MANRNIFEQNASQTAATVFNKQAQRFMIEEMKRVGTLKDAFIAHTAVMEDGSSDVPGLDEYMNCFDPEQLVARGGTLSHGIDTVSPEGFEDVNYPGIGLPDYTRVPGEMPMVDNRNEWVKVVLAGVSKTPFTYVKNDIIDIRAEKARAKGYLKGNYKEESFFDMMQRKTGPCTYFVKQHLEEEDVADITEFSAIELCRKVMNIKSDEELARAILIGDGRPKLLDNGDVNPDKIKEDCIRPIISDNEYFLISDTCTDVYAMVDQVLRSKENYRGSGHLTGFINYKNFATLMTKRDSLGHRMYHTKADLAAEMGVANLIDVPFIEDGTALFVDLNDYSLGSNKKMTSKWWEQFDINFNKRLMLLESRRSGALKKPFSAIKLTFEPEGD